MNDDQTSARVRIPRDRDNDYRDEMAATRRQGLVRENATHRDDWSCDSSPSSCADGGL